MIAPILTGLVVIGVSDTAFTYYLQDDPEKKSSIPINQWLSLVILLFLEQSFVWYRPLILGAVISFAANLSVGFIIWRALLSFLALIAIRYMKECDTIDIRSAFSFIMSNIYR